MNRKRSILQATFFLAALVASLFFAGTTRAQTISTAFEGKFTLTSTVRWGKGTIPPGTYTLRIESATSPIRATIYNDRDIVVARVISRAIEDYTGGSNALKLKTREGQFVVQSLVLADLDMVLVFDPSRTRERVEEARADSSAVLLARK